MPVAKRQVIEPGPFGTMQGDRVCGLAGLRQKLPNRAVSKPNADQSIFSFRGIKPFSEICCITSAPQRRRKHYSLGADWDLLGFIRNDHVAGERQPPEPRPRRFSDRRIMVSRQDNPYASKRLQGDLEAP